MIENPYKTKQTVAFSVLTVCVVAVIFWNSLQDVQASSELSSRVLTWLKPVLLALFGPSEELLHEGVRKMAHFVEFAALGLCLCGTADGLRTRFWRTSMLFFPLFAVLSVAVTDEFIQFFSDRSSAVNDVILDFFGGVFGMAIMAVLFEVLRSRKKCEV